MHREADSKVLHVEQRSRIGGGSLHKGSGDLHVCPDRALQGELGIADTTSRSPHLGRPCLTHVSRVSAAGMEPASLWELPGTRNLAGNDRQRLAGSGHLRHGLHQGFAVGMVWAYVEVVN